MLKHSLLILYAIVILVMAMASCFSQTVASEVIYTTWWFSVLWAILAALGIAYIVKSKMKRATTILLHASFIIILLGAFLTHITGRQSSMHLRKGVTTDLLDDGSHLPFTVQLKQFKVDYHNGTMAAADFTSSLLINNTEEAEISMNNIYSRQGVRLYQSAYDPDMLGSYVSVNMDAYGIPVTYLGYALLFLSLIMMLLDPCMGFRRALKKSMQSGNAAKTLLLLSLLTCSININAATVLPTAQAEEIGKLNILYNDRICPLQTYALDFTKKLTGSRSFDGNSAEQVLTGFLFFPKEWNAERVIRIKSGAVRERYGFDKYISLNDLFSPSTGEYVLGQVVQEAYRGNDDKLHQEVQKLDEKVMLIMSLEHAQSLRLFPYNGKWYASTDSLPPTIERERMMYFRHAVSLLGQFASTADWRSFSEMAQKMRKYQYTYGADAVPSNTQLWCEHVYNAVPFATILFMFCLTFGFLSLLRQRWIGITSRVALLLAWLTLTFCLALRWIISGTIPMSNGYESMLLMAWIIMLAALLMMRWIPILCTFGLVLSGFCLLVSHLSQLDPQITHVMPVLSSPLLTVHVSIIMMAYALLAITALCAIYGLCSRQRTEEMMTLSQLFLYPAMTCLGIGIFVGAIWANVSWGTYWSWDPKETWALITFMIYAAPLHATSLPSLRQPRIYHTYVLLSFLSVLITYFGVNFILGGMHSYA